MTTIELRQPVPGDADALTEMWARCSLRTRIERFHAPVRDLPARYTEAILGGAPQTLMACDGPTVRGVASLLIAAPGEGELGVLIEDDFQRQGLGGRLTRRLLQESSRRGITVVTASVLADRPGLLRRLRQVPGEHRWTHDGATVEVRVRLERRSAPAPVRGAGPAGRHPGQDESDQAVAPAVPSPRGRALPRPVFEVPVATPDHGEGRPVTFGGALTAAVE